MKPEETIGFPGIRGSNRAMGAAFAVLLLVLGTAGGALAEEPAKQPSAMPPAKVELGTVEMADIKSTLQVVGVARAETQSVVASEMAGKVVRFMAERGKSFQKGDLLAKLDDTVLQIDLKIAQAEKRRAEAERQKTEIDLKRADSLVSQKVWSERDLTNAQSDFQISKETVEKSEAEIESIQDRIRKTAIYAPFSGAVLEEFTERGEWVNEGGPICELASLDTIKVVAEVPEPAIPNIQEGMEVAMRIDALKSSEFHGKVSAIVPKGSEESHTYPVEILLPNPEKNIKVGMLCTVTFGETLTNSFLVPKDAVVSQGSAQFIFVVRNNQAVRVPVEVGAAKGDKVAVAGNLVKNEPVVIRGNERLFSGQPVIPVKF